MMSIKPEAAGADASSRQRELILLLAAWVVLAATMTLLAKQNLSVPGLYYDEAVFAGLAKDFVTGHVHGEHMPDHQVVRLAGRPFPLFIQTYLGALKNWMLIPAFRIFGPTVAVLRPTTLFVAGGSSSPRFGSIRPMWHWLVSVLLSALDRCSARFHGCFASPFLVRTRMHPASSAKRSRHYCRCTTARTFTG